MGAFGLAMRRTVPREPWAPGCDIVDHSPYGAARSVPLDISGFDGVPSADLGVNSVAAPTGIQVNSGEPQPISKCGSTPKLDRYFFSINLEKSLLYLASGSQSACIA